MCGRSRQTVEPQALASAVGFNPNVPLRRANQYRRSENAHPGNATPIAYKTTGGVDALRSMRWGLIPSFTKRGEKPNFFRMFNARSETAAEKPSFRRLVGRRHGVVAFTGFYEWKADAMGERQPYYFYFRDGRPMLFAVLYDTWQAQKIDGDGGGHGGGSRIQDDHDPDLNPNTKPRAQKEGGKEKEEEEEEELRREVEEEDGGGSVLFSYAVLTTSAAARLQWLHERMPVILRDARDAESWLRCEGKEASTFLKNHVPYSGEDLVWHPVSKQMNMMRYDGEDCSAAIELKPAKPLPAITSFFKKKEEPPCGDATGTGAAGGAGGVSGKGGVKIESPPVSSVDVAVASSATVGAAGSATRGAYGKGGRPMSPSSVTVASSSVTVDGSSAAVAVDRQDSRAAAAAKSLFTSASPFKPEVKRAVVGAGSAGDGCGGGGGGSGSGGGGLGGSSKAAATTMGSKRRAVHTPSPSKKGRTSTNTAAKAGGAGKEGSPAGAAAGATDRKQQRMTSFFRPTTT